MSQKWLDLKGPILANTVYTGGKLVAKDVTVTLPAVTPVTADFRAMGTLTMPILGQIEAMEASITKIGIDLGLRSLVKLTSKTIEIRWAQDVKLSDGSTKTEDMKYIETVEAMERVREMMREEREREEAAARELAEKRKEA